ncbi:hypothetical protein LIER_10365 [Lithospermum erythrorhizon]|uniref:Uncharacterized protein n=1 Tax=Lithospermum erythrorhizon TaxID=34254 RepID=A0AAV3PJ74_LITER
MIKRSLREQGVPVRHVKRELPIVNPSVEEVAVDSPMENQYHDDIVVVFYTTSKSKRRNRASVAAWEKKIATLGRRGRQSRKERERPKGQVLIKLGSVPKKRNGVVVSESKSLVRGNNFFLDDVVDESEEEDADEILRKRSKGKLKINDNRNRVNTRRIAKDVPDVPFEGVDFNSEEHEARWKFICARNILPERYMSDITYNNQTYIDILEGACMLVVLADIGPYWPKMVKEFVCNVSADIVDPDSPWITSATLKLADIVGELTGNALTTWTTKGQLQASSLSLKYAMLHKIAIATLVPTSINDPVTTSTAAPAAPTAAETFKSPMQFLFFGHVLTVGLTMVSVNDRVF